MTKLIRIISVVAVVFSSTILFTQESYHYLSDHKKLHNLEGWDYHKLYGIKINQTEGLNGDFYDPFKEALASNQLNEKRSVDLLLEQSMFAESAEDKHLYNALVSLKFFDQNEFLTAIDYSSKADRSYLSSELTEELDFKIGYSHFVNKNFDQADFYFDKNNKSYQHHNTYYGAMTKYFIGDGESAINGFTKIDNTAPYDAYVPYYLTQIYFAQKDFNQVVSYGENCINKPALENKNRVHKLLALANFELGQYEKANHHFAVYAEESPKLTKEEFYQIAYSQYKLKEYDLSIENFKEISNVTDTLGNLANYYIAEIYLTQGDKKAAQTAYGKLSKMHTIQELQEDAQLNYALLSHELGEERIAINTLSKYKEGDKYFGESQHMLNYVLRNSSDYKAALAVIEGLPTKSKELLTTYQDLSYKLAIQNFNDNTPLKSLTYLAIAEQTPGLSKIAAESIFWQSYIHHQDNNLLRSQALLDKYFEYTEAHSEVKDEKIYGEAHYLQAYKYWKLNEYKMSSKHFKLAIDANPSLETNQKSDAYTRIADVYLTENDYKNSSKFYTLALRTNDDLDYAAYQLGIVEGFEKGPLDKILVLEDFVNKYPDSEYSDDALYEIGISYFSLSKRNDALMSFDKLLANHGTESPMARKALLKKGLISYNAGDVDAAILAYKKVFELAPSAEEKKEALVALEEIYLTELNDPDSYFDIAEQQGGVKIDEFQKDSVSYAIAYDQFKNGSYEKSANAFSKYRSKYKNGMYKLPSLYFEGESYSLLKKYEEATFAYEQVIEQGASDYYVKALKKAALINYNHKQDNEKAFKYFDLLVNKQNLNELGFIEGALVTANLTNKNQQVIVYADRLIKHKESNLDQKATAHFYLAKAAQKEGKDDQAIKSYNEVVRMSKNNKAAEASYQVAELFYKQKNLEIAEKQALETTNRAVNYPYWVARSLLLLTDIFVDNKDVYNAKAAVDAILDNYADDQEIIAAAREKKIKVELLEASENRVIPSPPNNTLELDTIKTGK